jgi:hypothetical protein
MNAAVPEKGKILTEAEIVQVKDITVFSQDAVNYTTLSPEITSRACANCIFYRSTGFDGVDWPHCHIVDGWPLPIEPTGLCDEWRLNPGEEPYVQEPVPVVIVNAEVVTIAYEEMALDIPKSMMKKVRDFVGGLMPKAQPDPEPQAFAVFKSASGKMAWLARHTGKWIDREGEILAERAHEAYVDRVAKGLVDPPELWMWHAPGTKHGKAVAVWKAGGFVCAAGYFDDTEAGKSAFEYYQQHSGKIKLSHMFHYPKVAKINGVYHEYNTVEITTLPDGAEAFPYTNFEEIQTMALPDHAKNMIREALGAEVLAAAEALDSKAVSDTAKMDAAGIASKNYDNYTGSELIAAAAKVAEGEDLKAVKALLGEALVKLNTYAALPEAVRTLQETVTQLTTDLEEAKTREVAQGEALRALQEKSALLTDLQPPASQSSETLLNDREKSLVESMMAQAKAANTPSLVDTFVGGAPTVSS